MPRDDPHPAFCGGGERDSAVRTPCGSRQEPATARRALARANAAIHDAQSHGEAPPPALLTRVEEMHRELAVMSYQLAVGCGKTPRESVTAGLGMDLDRAQD